MNSPNQNIECVINLEAFFRDCIRDASRKRNHTLNHQHEYYLVTLLSSYMRLDESSTIHKHLDSPLAMLYQSALMSSGNERIPIFKSMGDKALYFSGFFQQFFSNKSYSVDYYISMGKNAYEHLSELFKQYGDNDFHELYYHLFERFDDSVDILREVSFALPGFIGEHDIINLLQQFQDTGSESLRQTVDRHLLPVVDQKDDEAS